MSEASEFGLRQARLGASRRRTVWNEQEGAAKQSGAVDGVHFFDGSVRHSRAQRGKGALVHEKEQFIGESRVSSLLCVGVNQGERRCCMIVPEYGDIITFIIIAILLTMCLCIHILT
jgi:hypothetical protein